MKILMLTPYLPYPLHSGGQIRSYNLLKNLSKKHQITLFSFIRSKEERKHVNKLKKFCNKVEVFQRRPAWDPRNIILAAFTPYPFLVAIYLSFSVRKAIRRELESGSYDLIHAETFYVMPNLPATTMPTLLVEQTIEYLVYQRFVEDFKLWFLKPFLYFDVYKIKLWEKFFWRRATSLAAMSDADRLMMQRSVKRPNVTVVANGVDINFFAKSKTAPAKATKPLVLFVGNFKWLPNKDAAVFLTHQVWPLIEAKLPEARLWIVGRNPTTEIVKLSENPKIKVTGDIDDIRKAFSKAQVLLAPIRNGRGTKYKVLEAMAAKTPVVTTKLGIEGIDAVNGQSVLIAESPQALADQAIAVLTERNLAKKLADNAKQLIIRKYSWGAISKRLDKIYQTLGGR